MRILRCRTATICAAHQRNSGGRFLFVSETSVERNAPPKQATPLVVGKHFTTIKKPLIHHSHFAAPAEIRIEAGRATHTSEGVEHPVLKGCTDLAWIRQIRLIGRPKEVNM
jgi:hypothetical protein